MQGKEQFKDFESRNLIIFLSGEVQVYFSDDGANTKI